MHVDQVPLEAKFNDNERILNAEGGEYFLWRILTPA